MMVMPSNNSGRVMRKLHADFPGRLGWLISPGGWRPPPNGLPVHLDNGAFGAWIKGTEWNRGAWWELIQLAHSLTNPKWAVVPDVVADREATLTKWAEWFPVIREAFPDLPLAMAVQDGMTPADIPEAVEVIFVGGNTGWKWRNLRSWTDNFPRVHVARVNTERLLWMAHDAGAESCDGTGWFRGDQAQLAGLRRYLEQTTFSSRPQLELF